MPYFLLGSSAFFRCAAEFKAGVAGCPNSCTFGGIDLGQLGTIKAADQFELANLREREIKCHKAQS